MPTENNKLVITFRSRLRPELGDALTELSTLGARMYELASAMPGFLSYKDYAAEDGEYVSLVEFDTAEHLAAWRNLPEHVAAQQAGRERFFASYQIQVCQVIREYGFDHAST